MKHRKWSNEQKLQIVLTGLKGQKVSTICSENGIAQSQYYKWRDQFFSNAAKAFDAQKVNQKQV